MESRWTGCSGRGTNCGKNRGHSRWGGPEAAQDPQAGLSVDIHLNPGAGLLQALGSLSTQGTAGPPLSLASSLGVHWGVRTPQGSRAPHLQPLLLHQQERATGTSEQEGEK